jgi:hypothetical protein
MQICAAFSKFKFLKSNFQDGFFRWIKSGLRMCFRDRHWHYSAYYPFDAIIVSRSYLVCPQAGRPRRRNAAEPGAISLRSIAPAKAAYLPAGRQVWLLVVFFFYYC